MNKNFLTKLLPCSSLDHSLFLFLFHTCLLSNLYSSEYMCHHLLTLIQKHHMLFALPLIFSLLSRPFPWPLPPPRMHTHTHFCFLNSQSQLWAGKLYGCHIQGNRAGMETTSRKTTHIPFSPIVAVSPSHNKDLPLICLLQLALLLLLMTFTRFLQSLLCNSMCTLRAIISLEQKDIQQASTFTVYIETLQFTGQPENLISESLQLCVFSFYWKAPTGVSAQLPNGASKSHQIVRKETDSSPWEKLIPQLIYPNNKQKYYIIFVLRCQLDKPLKPHTVMVIRPIHREFWEQPTCICTRNQQLFHSFEVSNRSVIRQELSNSN